MSNTNLIEITESPEAGTPPQLPVVFGSENLEALFKRVEDEVKEEVPDVLTVDGRARIKSLAAKVSSSKTAIDKPIRDHLRALKAIPKELEKNARESIERFDALRDSILAPLNEAQASLDRDLDKLNAIPALCGQQGVTSQLMRESAAFAESYDIDSVWPELKKKFKQAKDMALSTAMLAIERIEKEEAQAAELERLRAEAAIREQQDRDRRIAEQATEQARKEAELKAIAEREAIERRAVEAKQREEAAKAAEERAKRDAELAEQRRIEQEEKARLDAIAAAEKAKSDAELAAKRAVAAERERAELEAAEAERQANARQANKEHRSKINRAALVALISLGISEDDGKTVITAIAKGEVPSVKIFY